MKKIINQIINDAIEGVDVYHYKGSVWLILTNEQKWVLELKENGVLWYSYYFFENLFKYVSMDVVENQHYITMWVEDTIKNGVMSTSQFYKQERLLLVEDTIKNGVMSTKHGCLRNTKSVEDTIKNGVKNTKFNGYDCWSSVEDTIKNGVKKTGFRSNSLESYVEDTIQNGNKLNNI
jgi:hypothetical protein